MTNDATRTAFEREREAQRERRAHSEEALRAVPSDDDVAPPITFADLVSGRDIFDTSG